MGYMGNWYKLNMFNRSLQKNAGGKFSKGKFDAVGTFQNSDFNEKFEKEFSDMQRQKIKKQIRTEIRKEKQKSYLFTLVILLVITWIFWPSIYDYIAYIIY